MAQIPTATAQPARATTFQPYVPSNQTLREFTAKAIILGAAFGLLFGASSRRRKTTLGLVPMLHEGTLGLVLAGLLFFALATVLARVGQRKLA